MTTIELLDPADDEQFAVFHATCSGTQIEEWDRPYSALEQRVEFLEDDGYADQLGLLARDDDGTPVGVGIAKMPLKDNLSLVYVTVRVLPEHRRRGHGSALFDAIASIGRERGRSSLFARIASSTCPRGCPRRPYATDMRCTRGAVRAPRNGPTSTRTC